MKRFSCFLLITVFYSCNVNAETISSVKIKYNKNPDSFKLLSRYDLTEVLKILYSDRCNEESRLIYKDLSMIFYEKYEKNILINKSVQPLP